MSCGPAWWVAPGPGNADGLSRRPSDASSLLCLCPRPSLPSVTHHLGAPSSLRHAQVHHSTRSSSLGSPFLLPPALISARPSPLVWARRGGGPAEAGCRARRRCRHSSDHPCQAAAAGTVWRRRRTSRCERVGPCAMKAGAHTLAWAHIRNMRAPFWSLSRLVSGLLPHCRRAWQRRTRSCSSSKFWLERAG